MKPGTKWKKNADTIHIVYGVSIIVLAVVVGILAHTVITGEDFPLSGNPTQSDVSDMPG